MGPGVQCQVPCVSVAVLVYGEKGGRNWFLPDGVQLPHLETPHPGASRAGMVRASGT